MRVAHFCIERPIFATVISILVVLIGLAAYFTLAGGAVSRDRAADRRGPRAVSGSLRRGGERARLRRRSSRRSTASRTCSICPRRRPATASSSITVSFALGTDLDQAQVLVQNRVAVAEPRLPEEVRRLGVTVRKSSPDLLMVIQLFSPDGSRSPLYISNYATLQIRDALLRIKGVGDVRLPTARDYAMVAWLDPDKVAARNLTAGEVMAALRAQNVQVAAGVLNQPPVPSAGRIPAQRGDPGPPVRPRAVREHHRQDGCAAAA